MEIVHVIRQYKPSVGGLEAVVFSLCQQLARMPNVNVRIVTLNKVFSDASNTTLPSHEVLDGIEITRLNYFGSNRYPIALDVLGTLKSADIVHVHAVDFFFDYLAWTKWLHKKPLVASTHGGFFHTQFAARLKRIYFNTITRISCRSYQAICASSENDARTFRTISQKNVLQLENGVDVDKWRDCGSKTAQRSIVFIGRWSRNKRVPLLIELLAHLRKQADWKLEIIGLPSDDTMESLYAYCDNHEVKKHVNISLNPSEQDIKILLSSVSYIASASDYEGFGLSIVEGLSAGLIPIVTSIPPFKKLIEELSFGAYIDSEALEATAVKIEHIHHIICSEIQSFREKAMSLSEKYAWSGVAGHFLDVYREASSNA